MNDIDPRDDARVVASLQSSVILAAVVALMQLLWRAAGRSRFTELAVRARAEWAREDTRSRRLSIGVMLITAAVTSFVLAAMSDHPGGWLWIMPSAIAACVGMVLVLLSSKPRVTD